MKHALTIGLTVLLLAAALLVPAASAAAAVAAPQLVGVRVVPRGSSSAAPAACTLGRTTNDVFSSDTEDPFQPDPVYTFPASGGMFDLVSTVFDWPGGQLVQDVGLFVAGRPRPILIPGIDYGIVPAGDWYLVLTFTYGSVPPGTQVDWAHRVAACEPNPVGYPNPSSVPPLPFGFQ